uniref:Uncharacterized protein n=1 Tax=Tanacetum cinerariifolium TaxID=118510 RepID=A0A6L2LUB2_TANCI|nr:hypothetical protein [Tanacetum cinerariifolium]
MLFLSLFLDTELVLYPLQDKLTSGDKSLDLSAFKLSRLFFSFLSSRLHSLRTTSLNARVFHVDSGASEKKTVNKPSQTSQGILVGLKIGFKPQKEYRPVLKKTMLALAVIKRKVWNLLLRKFENLVIDRQAIFMDKAGNPLKKVEYLGDHDSEDEVASVDNDMARDLASERTGFGNQSLLE